jgi:hypothetical protein
MSAFTFLLLLTLIAGIVGWLFARPALNDGSRLAAAFVWIYFAPFYLLLMITVLVGLVGVIYSFVFGHAA